MRMLALGMLLLTPLAFAWDGTDQESGADIEIDAGNLVREGEVIDYYDYGSGDYHSGNVESVESNGDGTVDVEVYDETSGEYRTFEMEED